MEKFGKAKLITSVVWNSIWLVGGIFFWIVGLVGFIENTEFLIWLVWGILCTPFIIPVVIKLIKDQAKEGRREGANTYTATRIGNTVTVQNNPLGGAIKGGIAGLIGGVLMGPIFLPLTALNKGIDLVKNIMILVETKE